MFDNSGSLLEKKVGSLRYRKRISKGITADDNRCACRVFPPQTVAVDATRCPLDRKPLCNGNTTMATDVSSTTPQAFFPSLLHSVQRLHTADSPATTPLSPSPRRTLFYFSCGPLFSLRWPHPLLPPFLFSHEIHANHATSQTSIPFLDA